MSYSEYIQNEKHWKKVRAARYKFDEGRCVVCRTRLLPEEFEVHHLTYAHLGNEHLTDVITLCHKHHTIFHNNWQEQQYWKGRERGHWEVFSLEHTARLCAAYWREDRYICKDPEAPNLCNKDVDRAYVDRYFKELGANTGIAIDPNDFGLFVRNKRYEMFFEAEARGLTVEQFLDECYGPKVRGKNPLRQEAGKKNGTFDHEPKAFHRHYAENKNLNLLMEEVKKYE